MKDFLMVAFVLLITLALFGCGPEPVRYNEGAEKSFTFHTENDSLVRGGIREIEPGIFVKKFVLGNDVIYLRCDKDGNVLSHTEASLSVPSGKTRRFISII